MPANGRIDRRTIESGGEIGLGSFCFRAKSDTGGSNANNKDDLGYHHCSVFLPQNQVRSPLFAAHASFLVSNSNRAARDCGMTLTLASTGMKFVSPFQRGTRCQCKCPGTPAPATRPKLTPILNPSADMRLRNSRVMSCRACIPSSNSSLSRSSRFALCAKGATSRCPLLYGYRLSMVRVRFPRATTRFSESDCGCDAYRHKKQPSGWCSLVVTI